MSVLSKIKKIESKLPKRVNLNLSEEDFAEALTHMSDRELHAELRTCGESYPEYEDFSDNPLGRVKTFPPKHVTPKGLQI